MRYGDQLSVAVKNPANWLIEINQLQGDTGNDDINRIGHEALAQALGFGGMVRFLRQFETGSGDYTKERD